MTSDDPTLGTASFSTAVRYWRLRWGGDAENHKPNVINERLRIVDRAKVLGRTPG